MKNLTIWKTTACPKFSKMATLVRWKYLQFPYDVGMLYKRAERITYEENERKHLAKLSI